MTVRGLREVGMLTQEMNDLVARVGPGTPGGEFMRRYWHPVSLSQEITPGGKPKQVRILGEDLVLFRDLEGRPGLVGLHCSHRLVSLYYGRVEDGGIRCPMHGWLYDVSGRCLEQPAEPEGGFKERIRHLAYPCQDMGGLVFAYMGPLETMPLLPRYEVLVRSDGTRQCTWWPIEGNYLQHLEGAWDWIHAGFLHTNNWSVNKHTMAALAKPEVELRETEYGLRRRSDQWHPGGSKGRAYGYFFMPAGWLRLAGTWIQTQPRLGVPRQDDVQKFQSWFVPVDDGHTLRYQVAFAPLNRDGTPYKWRPDGELMQPGADREYGRDYDHVDTISGIDPSTAESFRAQDTMANETQGSPYMDRSREHLGAHDFILTAMRMMILKGIADVEKGLDPKHVIRDPEQNEIVYVRGTPADGTDELEMFSAERTLVHAS
jgi:phenylpropionate dioxygenase-like ring-hydroxylating dioxygenase large terminal subunit